MSQRHTRGTAGQWHKPVVLRALKLSQLVRADCPSACRAVGCAKGAVNDLRPLHTNGAAPVRTTTTAAWCARCCRVRVERSCSLTAPFAHPTANASGPRCASHPGGRAFLFTVSNSVVSSFPRRVHAPGFCFSLPPPDEGRRSAERRGGLRGPLARGASTCLARARRPRPFAIRDARLSALHRRFSDAVPRFRGPAFTPGHRAARSSQRGRSAPPADFRTSRDCAAGAAAGTPASLHLQERLRTAAPLSEDGGLISDPRSNV